MLASLGNRRKYQAAQRDQNYCFLRFQHSISYTNNKEISENDRDFKIKDQIAAMFKYPYFLSLCVCYFSVQLVKTVFSDWSQVYLIKMLKVDTFIGELS
jgi:sugar phosphate permease